MGGQTAEQIIAGVVLSERLAVTMYGAIHRAQFSGQRNLRGLVIDQRMLGEASFRVSLTEPKAIKTAVDLDHKNIVPTFAVESNGPDVVVVTRGVGRYVTVQDLISAARANRASGGKLPLSVAAAIGRSVVEALAAAHKAKVIHGAVHPRSVLVDEDGGVRLGDFIVGRALTTAVAQGADSSLWRGLSGFLAPEVVVGEDPTPSADVFAAGALLFTMLSGDVPPGTLHVTPAVERLVQRALDTDVSRRYKNATDLLENLLEAFEDDRWEIAERGEVIKAAGLSSTDTNIDDATEDLLASLGPSLGAVQASPIRPSMDIRAAALAAQHQRTPTGTGPNKLEALLADLDDSKEHTAVEDMDRFKRDPISELIQVDPRRREAIVQMKPRVPSLDDEDEDHTPLPPPQRPSSPSNFTHRANTPRPNTRDESAAMDALLELDGPVKRVESAADQASAAAEKLELAAQRAERAAARVETNNDEALRRSAPMVAAVPRPVKPIFDQPVIDDLPTPRLKSRAFGVVLTLAVIGGGVGFYFIYQSQIEAKAEADRKAAETRKKNDELALSLDKQQDTQGNIQIKSTPSQAGVWLKIGRTPADSIAWSSSMMHELRIEGIDGYQPVDVPVMPNHWSGAGEARKANINVTLQKVAKDKIKPLPAMPQKPPEVKDFAQGRGPIHVESTPSGAEVWMYVGMTDQVDVKVVSAQGYELRILKDKHRPAFVSIKPEDWRNDDPKVPLAAAKKKPVIEHTVTLEPEPEGAAKTPEKPEKKKGG
ncbi:MAG: protein kinase [Myxococcota bacterium]|nr:protein kinase [Myxococcota bacterium]